MNNTSCDGRRAFPDEVAQHNHVEYFQGFGRFHEKGLPWTLPAEKEAALEKDQHLIKLKNRMQQLKSEGVGDKDINRAKNKVRSYYDSLWRTTRQNYQTW